MNSARAQQFSKTKIFVFWLATNSLIDGFAAAYLNKIPYTVILFTFLLFSFIAVLLIYRTKFKRDSTGIIMMLAASFLYILSLNLATSLYVPYLVLFYPVIISGIFYIDKMREPAGLKRFWLYFSGYVLAIAGAVVYDIQLLSS